MAKNTVNKHEDIFIHVKKTTIISLIIAAVLIVLYVGQAAFYIEADLFVPECDTIAGMTECPYSAFSVIITSIALIINLVIYAGIWCYIKYELLED